MANQPQQTLIDLSKLPSPKIIEELSFETIRKEIRDDYLASMREEFEDAELFDSDPAAKLIDVVAAREVILRQRVNDAAKACLYPFSDGADLDNLVSFFNTQRTTLPEIDPETNQFKRESDDSLRERGLLAFDQFSTAGAPSAYAFHTRKIGTPLGLVDLKALTPVAGTVKVVLLFKEHRDEDESGVALEKLGKIGITKAREQIASYLSGDGIKPLTDTLDVVNATVKKVKLRAKLYIPSGVDKDIVIKFAVAKLEAYRDQRYKVGANIPLSGLYAALTVPNVERVVLEKVWVAGEAEPEVLTDIMISDEQAALIEFVEADITAEVGE